MTCPTYSEITLDAWANELLAPINGGRYPLGGTIELTERCNLSCVHCYINQPAAIRQDRQGEMTTAEVKKVIDMITAAGCLYLLLTGGEPMLRPDFDEIYRYAKQKGMLISLFTNGTLLTPEIADLLAAMSVYSIEISLYGATRETYEAVTRHPGSFKRCLNGINLLKERGLPLGLKSVLLRTNKHELEAMRQLAADLDLDFRYDGTIWPRVDGNETPYAQRISAEEMLSLDTNDPERRAQWQKSYDRFGNEPIREELVFTCGAGLQTFHIDSQGRMSVCIMVREPSYDLKKVPFATAWQELGKLRELKRVLHTPCETCLAGSLCSQCPGWSQLSHGDLETADEWTCKIGKLRLDEFGA